MKEKKKKRHHSCNLGVNELMNMTKGKDSFFKKLLIDFSHHSCQLSHRHPWVSVSIIVLNVYFIGGSVLLHSMNIMYYSVGEEE